MSQIVHGAEAQLGWLMGWTTLMFLAAMVGWTLWAYAPWRKQWMEDAGRIPLEGGDA